ncbi:RING-H2 finger protein ATL46-like [Triticum urartu]|uniref:RING-H2 finger protein ATL46-like n=1 Tax=Triticum dicoccoides TaxID=85692 RepID=UPI00189131A5|nr:RING-H2 finger protein ATL46-like [Triticum dicoccoides]XP_048539826.1 RING-H2 finger protein ATL46-like [Triticum urartu]
MEFAPPPPWHYNLDPPSYEFPAIRPWYPPPPPPSSDDEWKVTVSLVVFFAVCILGVALKGCRSTQSHAEAEAAAAARPLPRLESLRQLDEVQLAVVRPTNPTARLPAFKYNQSVKHNMTGGGEEAATCSVCLGVFQPGEAVRLLPACMHLYHVECIDPWLDAHSTCPLCRSDADPMDGARLPPV